MQRVRDLAMLLRAAGVGAGDRVGVRMSSGTADLYTAILGVLAAGAAYVPVDADDPDERAATILEEADVCGVLGDGMAFADRRGTGRARPEPSPPPGRRRLDHLHVRIDGKAQGRRDHPPLRCGVRRRRGRAVPPRRATRARRPGARRAVGGVRRLLRGDVAGLAVRCVPGPRAATDRAAGAELGPWLVERRVTVVSTVPTLAALWPSEALARVRLLIFGGEACPPELVERLAAPGREVWNTYGPTEATVVACAAPLVPGQPVRIGLPLRWLAARRRRPAGQPGARGETGELVIGGAGLGRYLDAAKDAEKYRPVPSLGWAAAYYSGDLVSSDDAGSAVRRTCRRPGQARRATDRAGRDRRGAAGPAARDGRRGGGEEDAGRRGAPRRVPGGRRRRSRPRRRRARRWPSGCRRRSSRCSRSSTTIPTRTSGKVDRKALPWPPPGQDDGATPGPGPRRTCPVRRLAGPHLARDPGRADRARLRLLRSRRQQPGHGDAGVGAARALPHGRGLRHLPTADVARAGRVPRRVGAGRGHDGRSPSPCPGPGCGPRWRSSRSSRRPRRSPGCAGHSDWRCCTTSRACCCGTRWRHPCRGG